MDSVKLKLSDKAPKGLKKFFYTDAYLVAFVAVVYLTWYTKEIFWGFLAGSVLAGIALIVVDDFKPMLPVALYAPAMFAMKDPTEYFICLTGAIPLVIGLVFHLIYYRPERKKMRMLIPQLLIAAAMLLGGAGVIAKENYLGTLAYTLMLGFLPLIFYLLFALYGKEDKGFASIGKYTAKTFTWYGILIGMEIITLYVVNKPPFELWGRGFVIDAGWSIDNNLATILLLASPMGFYLALTEKQKLLYTVLGIINFCFTVLTFSRGGILFGTIMAALTAIYAMIKCKGRVRLKIVIPVAAVVVAILTVYFLNMNELNAYIARLANVGDKTISGRDKLYAEAIECFRNNPIFGAGMGFDGEYYAQPEGMYFYWFHSTLFQIIGSTGAVGIVAFAIFYAVRYGIVFRRIRSNLFAQFALLSFLGFEAYSMMDTGTFIPYPIMVMAMLLTLAVERTNEVAALAPSDKRGLYYGESY